MSGSDTNPYRHQIVEIPPINPIVIEHRLHQLTCSSCRTKTRATLPAFVNPSGYGVRVVALVALLSGVYRNSQRLVQSAMKEVFGVSMSLGTVNKELPEAQSKIISEAASIDGGKICLRGSLEQGGQWRDYKLVSLHENICEAFFQAPEALQSWSEAQPLSPIFTFLGDGHDGIWKLSKTFGGHQIAIKREILDWYHLKENLYRVGGSLKRLQRVENWLWQGKVETASAEFAQLKSKKARNFQSYLLKHRQRIPNYHQYQQLGITIGSGDVESKIKQVGARVKLSGARWNASNVTSILRLRCAYLNHSKLLSIYTYA